MNVFVLRDSKGSYLGRDFEIGPLFDIAEFFEAQTGEKTAIKAEELADVLLEIKETAKSTT